MGRRYRWEEGIDWKRRFMGRRYICEEDNYGKRI